MSTGEHPPTPMAMAAARSGPSAPPPLVPPGPSGSGSNSGSNAGAGSDGPGGPVLVDVPDDSIFALTAVDVAEAENRVFYFLENHMHDVLPDEEEPSALTDVAAASAGHRVTIDAGATVAVDERRRRPKKPVNDREWQEAFEGALIVAKYNLHETTRHRRTLEGRLQSVLAELHRMADEYRAVYQAELDAVTAEGAALEAEDIQAKVRAEMASTAAPRDRIQSAFERTFFEAFQGVTAPADARECRERAMRMFAEELERQRAEAAQREQLQPHEPAAAAERRSPVRERASRPVSALSASPIKPPPAQHVTAALSRLRDDRARDEALARVYSGGGTGENALLMGSRRRPTTVAAPRTPLPSAAGPQYDALRGYRYADGVADEDAEERRRVEAVGTAGAVPSRRFPLGLPPRGAGAASGTAAAPAATAAAAAVGSVAAADGGGAPPAFADAQPRLYSFTRKTVQDTQSPYDSVTALPSAVPIRRQRAAVVEAIERRAASPPLQQPPPQAQQPPPPPPPQYPAPRPASSPLRHRPTGLLRTPDDALWREEADGDGLARVDATLMAERPLPRGRLHARQGAAVPPRSASQPRKGGPLAVPPAPARRHPSAPRADRPGSVPGAGTATGVRAGSAAVPAAGAAGRAAGRPSTAAPAGAISRQAEYQQEVLRLLVQEQQEQLQQLQQLQQKQQKFQQKQQQQQQQPQPQQIPAGDRRAARRTVAPHVVAAGADGIPVPSLDLVGSRARLVDEAAAEAASTAREDDTEVEEEEQGAKHAMLAGGAEHHAPQRAAPLYAGGAGERSASGAPGGSSPRSSSSDPPASSRSDLSGLHQPPLAVAHRVSALSDNRRPGAVPSSQATLHNHSTSPPAHLASPVPLLVVGRGESDAQTEALREAGLGSARTGPVRLEDHPQPPRAAGVVSVRAMRPPPSPTSVTRPTGVAVALASPPAPMEPPSATAAGGRASGGDGGSGADGSTAPAAPGSGGAFSPPRQHESHMAASNEPIADAPPTAPTGSGAPAAPSSTGAASAAVPPPADVDSAAQPAAAAAPAVPSTPEPVATSDPVAESTVATPAAASAAPEPPAEPSSVSAAAPASSAMSAAPAPSATAAKPAGSGSAAAAARVRPLARAGTFSGPLPAGGPARPPRIETVLRTRGSDTALASRPTPPRAGTSSAAAVVAASASRSSS